MSVRRTLILVGLLAVTPIPVAQAEGVLRRATFAEPESLDPQRVDGLNEWSIASDLFEGLTRLNPLGRAVPALAASWEVSPDGLVWTFHLRQGLQWSDGTPLVAADLVWSLRRALDPATTSPTAVDLYPIVGAQAFNEGTEKPGARLGLGAPDSTTLTITLNNPTPYLASVLAEPEAAALPRQAIEAAGPNWARPGRFPSSGAFVLASWEPNAELVLKRNPHYWDATAPILDEVHWIPIEKEETGLKRYRAGEVDIVQVAPKVVPLLKAERPEELHTDPELRADFVSLNTRRKPLDDPRVRRALSMLVDRQTLVEKIDPHGERAASSLVPPGIEGYVQQMPDWAAESMETRRTKARDLLAAAGIDQAHPLTLEFIYPIGDGARLDAVALAEMWRGFGIEAKPSAREFQVLSDALQHHQFELGLYAWIASYVDPVAHLSILRTTDSGWNTGAYSSPAFDTLFDKAATMRDPAERMATLEAAERVANQDAPLIPIYYGAVPSLVSPKVRGYVGSPLEITLSRDLSISP